MYPLIQNYGVKFVPLVVLLILWTLIWKGLAVWKSARRGNKAWFVAFLIVNTAGILEILYLYIFSKKEPPAADKSAEEGKK